MESSVCALVADQRKALRAEIADSMIPCIISGTQNQALLAEGHLRDISESGIGIVVTKRYAKSDITQAQEILIDFVSCEIGRFCLSATVKHSELVDGVFRIGAAFISPTQALVKRVKNLVKSWSLFGMLRP